MGLDQPVSRRMSWSGLLVDVEPAQCSADVRHEKRLCSLDRPMNGALRRIPVEDFLDALGDLETLSPRSDREVGGDERVHQGSLFERKGCELVRQATLSRFDAGACVVGDQSDEPQRVAATSQVSGTVKGVQASVHEVRRITDVV